jgi:hypothetical protein
MALFEQYTKPGVYTREVVEDPGIILFGDLRIPIFIGEGQETFSFKNIELHRGSSAVADDLVVKENISDQITGFTREFQLGYFPVVRGDGTGTTTNTPTDIKVLADGVPATVTNLNGAAGSFVLHSIYVPGTQLEVTYYFKRMDTAITDEDLSDQIPSYATWTDNTANLTLTLPGALGSDVKLGLISLGGAGATAATQLVKSDAFAVMGAGTNDINIELLRAERAPDFTAMGASLTFAAAGKTITRASGSWIDEGVVEGDAVIFSTTGGTNTTAAGVHHYITNLTATEITLNTAATVVNQTINTPTLLNTGLRIFSLRTYGDLANLIEVGIPTPSGYITLQTAGSLDAVADTPVLAKTPAFFDGGDGPTSNTVFKLKSVPVVDGSNGGVVTTNPNFLTAKVNNLVVPIKAVDGMSGTITMTNPVLAGQTFTVTYYTNTYQDTYDLLPASNVATLDLVGFGPDREDFINTVDYVLEQPAGKNARIQWGASSSIETGVWTAGFNPFDASVMTTTIVDQRMFLMACQGTIDGINTTYTLPDVPTEGNGTGRVTNDPALIHVYVGTDPHDALLAGEVRVIQLFGATGTFKLYSPPGAGNLVYASYYRNILNDHTFTFTVDLPGIVGQGTYTIQDELGNVLPVIQNGTNAVTEADFTISGIKWPYSFPDLTCVGGQSPDETITLTFQDDGDTFLVSPATPGSIDAVTNNTNLRFYTTTVGDQTQSNVKVIFADPGAGNGADGAGAIVVNSGVTPKTVTVNIRKVSDALRTLQEIQNLFVAHTPTTTETGIIIADKATPSSVLTGTAATMIGDLFTDGVDAVTTPLALRYKVTSSRTSQDALADGLGRTGGATTPVGPNSDPLTSVGTVGWLNQTYNDLDTGVNFTILNPDDVLDGPYGYTDLPSPRYHFQPGDVITFTVNSAAKRYTGQVPTIDVYGMRVKIVNTYGMKAGDTAILNTYNKAGSEPHVGDFYYVSYTTRKTDDDLTLKIYTNPADAIKQYGPVNATNKLSLATRLYAQNGGTVFGCIQVRKDIGLETAADQSYMTAIASLAAPVPGSDRKCDMIIPMTTSPVVLQYLNRHLLTQGAQRNSGEAIGIYGHDFYATPDTMRALARSLKAERMIGIGAPGAILEIDVAGKSAEFAVGGEFLAAAMTGMVLNPAGDVATTLTKQNMVGFSRLIRRYDDPTMDLMAADGLTCLVERSGAFQIRHWVTTDNSSPLKREPTSRLIIDSVRKIVRRNLDQFIGRKLLQSAINSVTVTTTSTLKALVEQEIIEGFKNLLVTRDEYDPTVLHVAFTVKPIFSLLWIDVALTVTTKL